MAYSQDGELEFAYEGGDSSCVVTVGYKAEWAGSDHSVGIYGPYVEEISAETIHIDGVEVVWDSSLSEWILAVFPCIIDPVDFLNTVNRQLEALSERLDPPNSY